MLNTLLVVCAAKHETKNTFSLRNIEKETLSKRTYVVVGNCSQLVFG